MEHELLLTNWLIAGDEKVHYFIGGGGKTSTIRHVAETCLEKGLKVLIATTTKVLISEFTDYHTLQVGDRLTKQDLEALRAIWRAGEIPVLYRSTWPEKKKYLGHEPEVLEAIRRQVEEYLHEQVILLVEADGARNRPLKAPYPHEPVISEEGNVVVLIGSEVLGERLDPDMVYGYENILKVLRKDAPFILGAEELANLVVHPEGYMKGVHNKKRLKVIFNKSESQEKRSFALECKRLLEKRGVDCKVISLLAKKEYEMCLATLVLAAGTSSRMGRDKQTLSCGEMNFLEKTVSLYQDFGEVSVVLGHNLDEIMAQSSLPGVQIIENPNYRQGMGSSLVAGVQALQELKLDGIWITFCDMPHLKEETLAKLYQCVLANSNRIVLPSYEGRRGHPAYVPADLFSELLAVQGDVGAREVLKRHEDRITFCPVLDQAVIEDVDQKEILEHVREREAWK